MGQGFTPFTVICAAVKAYVKVPLVQSGIRSAKWTWTGRGSCPCHVPMWKELARIRELEAFFM